MKCEYCENEVTADARICPSCGASVRHERSATITVSSSPHQVVHKQMINQSVIEQFERVPKSRVAYILLGLFLGGLGIHNFYAGRPNRALGQLLTTLLAGWLIIPLFAVFIWCIVDICAITTDGDGVRFT